MHHETIFCIIGYVLLFASIFMNLLKEDVFFKNTFNVHRKKETNTLYTTNAVNIISMQKIGRIDPNFKINWNNYKNCLLLSKDNQLIEIFTYLNKIVEF